MNPRPDGTYSVLSANDLESVVYFWRLYPRLFAECYQDEDVDDCFRLDMQHTRAEQLMAAEAERCGLDSTPIRKSGDLCRRITQDHPELGEEKYALWPSCLETRTTGLAERFRATIQVAEDVLSRLCAMKTSGSEADGPWSKPRGLTQWSKRFGCNVDTLKKYFREGKIRYRQLSTKSYRIHDDDVPGD